MRPFEPKKLLVATDMTPASEAAVAFAADLADPLRAEVILLHAISPIGFVDYGLSDDDTMRHAVDDQSLVLEEKLHELIMEFFPQHVSIRSKVVSGYPISSICQAAREESVDLILMGSHGRNVVMSFLVGSVTQGVMVNTSRPLIIVPRRRNALDREEVMTILCPVNFTDVAMKALTHAAELAAKLGAEVVALHLVEPEELSHGNDVRRRLEDWIPTRLREICDVRVLVHRGNAAEEVVRYAGAQRMDMIVIGAERKPFVNSTVLGTTTERVTRHAPCAVMVVIGEKDAPLHVQEEPAETPAAV